MPLLAASFEASDPKFCYFVLLWTASSLIFAFIDNVNLLKWSRKFFLSSLAARLDHSVLAYLLSEIVTVSESVPPWWIKPRLSGLMFLVGDRWFRGMDVCRSGWIVKAIEWQCTSTLEGVSILLQHKRQGANGFFKPFGRRWSTGMTRRVFGLVVLFVLAQTPVQGDRWWARSRVEVEPRQMEWPVRSNLFLLDADGGERHAVPASSLAKMRLINRWLMPSGQRSKNKALWHIIINDDTVATQLRHVADFSVYFLLAIFQLDLFLLEVQFNSRSGNQAKLPAWLTLSLTWFWQFFWLWLILITSQWPYLISNVVSTRSDANNVILLFTKETMCSLS